jgi:hypothetical protein
VHVAGPVGGEDHKRRNRCPDRLAQFRDGDGVVLQHLEQQRLELIVCAVYLVDEQHCGRFLDRPENGPAQEELWVVKLVQRQLRGTIGLRGPHGEDLLGKVPVVEGLGGVHARVALQPEPLGTECGGDPAAEVGLADARSTFEEERPLQPQRQIRRGRQRLTGPVVTRDQTFGKSLRGVDLRPSHLGLGHAQI